MTRWSRVKRRQVERAARQLNDRPAPGWPTFHAAVAAGLVGDARTAGRRFGGLATLDPSTDWGRELRALASELDGLLGDADAYRRRVVQEIAACRDALHLEPLADVALDALLRSRTAR